MVLGQLLCYVHVLRFQNSATSHSILSVGLRIDAEIFGSSRMGYSTGNLYLACSAPLLHLSQ